MRSEPEIMQEMLEIIRNGPILVTHLMYKANLNSAQIKTYVGKALELELISKMDSKYVLTEAGLKMIKELRHLNVLLVIPKATPY